MSSHHQESGHQGQGLFTLAGPVKGAYRVERSLFLAQATPVSAREEAMAYVQKVREEYHDATHHPYAYRLGEPPAVEEYAHDHGEPTGTAGRPLLGVLRRYHLTNVVMVVTRYFGGKKLGVRGLIEAYEEAALRALTQASLLPYQEACLLEVSLPYAVYEAAVYLCKKAQATIQESSFADQARLWLVVPVSNLPALQEGLVALGAVIGKPQPSK